MNIAIVYATLSGNTQAIAKMVYDTLIEKQYTTVSLFDMQDITADILLSFDLVFLGCSTWGDGDMNLILDIFLDDAEVSCHCCNGTKFAIISLGDSMYDNFAVAGKIAEEKIKKMNGCIVADTLKIDGYPTKEHYTYVTKWVLNVIKETSETIRHKQ